MQNMFKIIGNEQNFPEFRQFHQLGNEFLPFAQKKLGFNKPVEVNLVSDPENAKDPLGKTAYYDPSVFKITLFVDKRHVKDILRSLSHELVHHTQNCRGDFDNNVDLGEGNFTTNKALQKLELEAYAEGNGRLVREFEDYKKNMNESISYLLRQSILKENMTMSEGYKRDKVEEEEVVEESEELEEQSKTDRPDRVAGRDTGGRRLDEEELEEEDENLEEALPSVPPTGKGKIKSKMPDIKSKKTAGKKKKWPGPEKPHATPMPKVKPIGKQKSVQENWFKGNKDQLLFESLMKKWVK